MFELVKLEPRLGLFLKAGSTVELHFCHMWDIFIYLEAFRAKSKCEGHVLDMLSG